MEVRLDQQEHDLLANQRRNVLPLRTSKKARGGLRREDAGELLEQWRSRELSEIKTWIQCRGLSDEQREDVYQETLLALLKRSHNDEEHLRYALRSGIRKRALNMRRDELGRQEILASSQPEMRLLAEARQALEQPERVVLAEEDRLVVREFVAELSDSERQIYELVADGMSYHRIARIRGIPVNDARRLVRSCERKSNTFRLLYEKGRLCGARAATIRALQNGEHSSQELAEQALAHLESCAHCRAEHKTNANRLRRSFRDQAAALLPGPLVATRLGWPARFGLRARIVQHRVLTGDLIFGGNGARGGRAIALLTGSGVTAKVATGGVALVLLAGGALDATGSLDHRSIQPREPSAVPPAPIALPPKSAQTTVTPQPPKGPRRTAPRAAFASSPGHAVQIPRRASASTAPRQREPGGFVYLGVPSATGSPKSVRAADRGLFSP